MAPLDNIAHWRTQIFGTLLSISLALGFATALPSIAVLAGERRWLMIAVDAAALGWLVGLWYCKRAAYLTRVLHFMAIMIMVGTALTIHIGPVSQIYLFAVPMLCAILLGTGPAMIGLAATTLLVFGLSVSGHAMLPEHGLLPSAIVALNFGFIGAVITISCSILLQRLAKSLEDVRAVAVSLQQGQDALQALNAELRLTAAAVARLNDMVVIAKVMPGDAAQQQIIFVNDAFERRTGYLRPDVMGQSWHVLLGADTEAGEVARIGAAVARVEAVSAELLYYTKTHDPYWIEMELVPFNDENGNNTHWVMVGRDITERKKSEKHIHRLAFFDVLTGLPNRRLLDDRIETTLQRAARHHTRAAVMYLDLDGFKAVNDTYGHACGDTMLKMVATRLLASSRKEDTVARIGGDEFVIVLADVAGAGDAQEPASKLVSVVAEPYRIDDLTLTVSTSIGIAIYPDDASTADTLISVADDGLYQAKRSGKNRFCCASAAPRQDVAGMPL